MHGGGYLVAVRERFQEGHNRVLLLWCQAQVAHLGRVDVDGYFRQGPAVTSQGLLFGVGTWTYRFNIPRVVEVHDALDGLEVAVVKGSRGHEPVFRALDLINYGKYLVGFDKVLIKVNFITTKTWDTGATTDPIVVEAIVRKLKKLQVEIYVAESDATMTSADKAFEATGMKKMCELNNVKCLNLRHVKDRVKIKIPNRETLKNITVPRARHSYIF